MYIRSLRRSEIDALKRVYLIGKRETADWDELAEAPRLIPDETVARAFGGCSYVPTIEDAIEYAVQVFGFLIPDGAEMSGGRFAETIAAVYDCIHDPRMAHLYVIVRAHMATVERKLGRTRAKYNMRAFC